MEYISNVLFWIANGLLVPVVVGLLLMFGRAVWVLCGFVGVWAERRRWHDGLAGEIGKVRTKEFGGVREECRKGRHGIHKVMGELIDNAGNEALMERLVCDYEIAKEKECVEARVLIKFGPILGLLGTLIPMGPALAGLASGDVGTMAANMQMAFATTVVGLLTGAVGFVVLQAKSRWLKSDMVMLDFIINMSRQ